MPTYEFDIVDSEGALIDTINLRLPMDKRDDVCLLRRTAPRSININSAANPMNQANEVISGYRKLEEKIGSNRNFQRCLGEFTPKQIKEAWAAPDPD